MIKNYFSMFLYLGGELQGTFAHININSRIDNTYHKYTIIVIPAVKLTGIA